MHPLGPSLSQEIYTRTRLIRTSSWAGPPMVKVTDFLSQARYDGDARMHVSGAALGWSPGDCPVDFPSGPPLGLSS